MTARTSDATPAPAERAGNWTVRLRTRLAHTVPPGQVLPDRQPAYVASWIYVFGVLTLAAFLVVLASGGVLAARGRRLVAHLGRRPLRQLACTCGASSCSSPSW